MESETPEQIIARYFDTYGVHGFEFDVIEQNGIFWVKHSYFEANKHDLETWLKALRVNLDRYENTGPYHVYLEFKRITDTKQFPEKLDAIIQSAFSGSKYIVFNQKHYKENRNNFPEPSEMKNNVIFQISGSAGETKPFKPLCTLLYYICQRFCSLFSAKKNYDKWEKEDKLAFTDVTGYNYKAYKNRAFINFPDFMITNKMIPDILDQQKAGKILRVFLVEERFMASPKGTVANLLSTQVDLTKTPSQKYPYWWKKPETPMVLPKKGEWTAMDSHAFKIIWWIGFLSTFWFLLFTGIAMYYYPDGYSFWYNYLSDLGMEYTFSLILNEPTQTLWKIAVYGFALCQVIFHIGTWGKIYQYTQEHKVLIFFTRLFGILTAIIFALIAYFPKGLNDPIINPHAIVAYLFGLVTFGVIVPWTIIITKENNTKTELMIGYSTVVFFLVAVLIFALGPLIYPPFALDGSFYKPTFQKLIVVAYVYWYFTLCYWMFQKGLKMKIEE